MIWFWCVSVNKFCYTRLSARKTLKFSIDGCNFLLDICCLQILENTIFQPTYLCFHLFCGLHMVYLISTRGFIGSVAPNNLGHDQVLMVCWQTKSISTNHGHGIARRYHHVVILSVLREKYHLLPVVFRVALFTLGHSLYLCRWFNSGVYQWNKTLSQHREVKTVCKFLTDTTELLVLCP